MPWPHPREPRRARGINRWRARCGESRTPGSEGGCTEKAHIHANDRYGTSPCSPPYPRSGPPRGDLRLIALRRPVRGHLRAEPDPVQQVRHAAQRVAHVEQPGDQRGGPGQRPPLVLIPAGCGRARIQRGTQPGQLLLTEPAYRPACAPGRQRGRASGPPAPPPLVRRLGADPQQPGYLHRVDVLLKHLRGLQPQLLSAGPSLSGQAATIRVPHISGVDPPATQFTQARRL